MINLKIGDLVTTKYADRRGRVIKVYSDGSAGVRFDDSKSDMPDDGFFFDERICFAVLVVLK